MSHGIQGLFYHKGILSVDEQKELIDYLESIPEAAADATTNETTTANATGTIATMDLQKDSLHWDKAGIANRKVLHFGYKYPYSRILKLVPTHNIPEIFLKLAEKLKDLPGIKCNTDEESWIPDQVIVNRYLHKQGISAHTDHKKLFKEKIVCVSLGEAADMLFKHMELENATIRTESGSVYVMTGKARWEYTHEMIPNKFVKPRYSITFRMIDPKYVVPNSEK